MLNLEIALSAAENTDQDVPLGLTLLIETFDIRAEYSA